MGIVGKYSALKGLLLFVIAVVAVCILIITILAGNLYWIVGGINLILLGSSIWVLWNKWKVRY